MDYYYNYNNMDVYSLMGTIMIWAFVIAFVVMAVFYIFEALGVYQISKKRGYQKPWLAFIPVANSWVLGGIADNINYTYGKQSRFRVWLLAVECVWALLYVIYFIVMFAAMQDMILSIMYDSSYMPDSFALLSVFPVLFSLLSIGHLVIRYIVVYKLFQDYEPKNAVVYLVLSIVLGIGCFLIFACRNKPSASLYWSYCRQNPGSNGAGGNPVYSGVPYGSGNPPYGAANPAYRNGNANPPYGNGAAPYGNGAPPYGNSNPTYGNVPPQNGTQPYAGQPYTGQPNAGNPPQNPPSYPQAGQANPNGANPPAGTPPTYNAPTPPASPNVQTPYANQAPSTDRVSPAGTSDLGMSDATAKKTDSSDNSQSQP